MRDKQKTNVSSQEPIPITMNSFREQIQNANKSVNMVTFSVETGTMNKNSPNIENRIVVNIKLKEKNKSYLLHA